MRSLFRPLVGLGLSLWCLALLRKQRSGARASISTNEGLTMRRILLAFALLAVFASYAFAQDAAVTAPGLQPQNNLSDVPSPAVARANLGPSVTPEQFGALGTGATYFDGATTQSSGISSAFGTSATPATPSVTTVNANDTLLSIIVFAPSWSAAPSFTNTRVSIAQGGGKYGMLIGDQIIASPGATAPISGTSSSSSGWATASVALVQSGGTLTYVSNSTFQTSTSLTVSLTAPSGETTGDYLIGCIGYFAGGTASPSRMTPPVGWHIIDAVTNSGNPNLTCWMHIATASEPGSYVWNYQYSNGSSVGITAAIVDYRNTSGAENLTYTLTSSSASFPSTSVGQPICVVQAINNPQTQAQKPQNCGTITAVNSVHSINTSISYGATASSLQFAFGNDDTTAFQNMLASAPCSTTGCWVALRNKHYVLTGSLTLPPAVSITFQGQGPAIINTAGTFFNSQTINNPGGTQLQWLTQSLTTPAITIGGTLHITNSTSIDQLRDLTLYAGVSTAMDGGGQDGIDILNWQGAVLYDVQAFNWFRYGCYMDGMAASSDLDYLENIELNDDYFSLNGGGGVVIGSSLAVSNLESISITGSVIEGNGGPAVIAAGGNIQGLFVSGNTIQWDNRLLANPEINVTGSVTGGVITGNYFESDTNFQSQSNGVVPATPILGVRVSDNYVAPASGYTLQTFSAAGTALPTCSTSAKIEHQTATVSDSTACTIGTTYTSGGSTRCNVTCNGTNWVETGAASY